jgi:hypothetical chaperone protein
MRHFRNLLEHNLSYALFSRIEHAKRRLSEADQAEIQLNQPGLALREELTRPELDKIVAPHLEKIWHAAQQLLDQTNTSPAKVSRVIMTGGTSFMPIIFQRFQQHFGVEKVIRKNAFLSVVEGLALSTRAVWK